MSDRDIGRGGHSCRLVRCRIMQGPRCAIERIAQGGNEMVQPLHQRQIFCAIIAAAPGTAHRLERGHMPFPITQDVRGYAGLTRHLPDGAQCAGGLYPTIRRPAAMPTSGDSVRGGGIGGMGHD